MRNLVLMTSIALAAAASSTAFGQGQVNGAGATLFVDFFRAPASTNDFIDADGDGIVGPIDTNSDGIPDTADQLANSSVGSWNNFGAAAARTWFLLQYRSVGSVRGFEEFIEWHICGDLPEDIPSERGIINRADFAVTGVVTWVGPPNSCVDDTDGDGIANFSGTPYCPESIDFANTDVETTWAVQGTSGAAIWSATPTGAGYGQNPSVSGGAAGQTGESNMLPTLALDCDGNGSIDGSLNVNIVSPDAGTIYDTTIAFSPVAFIANRGTGVGFCDLRYTDLQHLFVTGRTTKGENLAVCTRDVGSGTRNAAMNPIGVDTSWGVGDHVGIRTDTSSPTTLGIDHQHNNCGGSSIMESAVQNHRLAIGYTGLFGGSRAVVDALAGSYEICNVIKDIDSDGNGSVEGTKAVRPSRATVLINDDPNTGYQVGGLQTFSTVGNPNANRDPGDPLYNATWPPMANNTAAQFINNIVSSVVAFQDPNNAPDIALMPAQLLAREFALTGGVSAVPDPANPKNFLPNALLNADLQQFLLNPVPPPPDTPAWGSINPAGRCPTRRTNPDWNRNGTVDPNDVYSDGSANGNYFYGPGPTYSVIGGGARLSASNAVTGDFDQDGDRDCDDIDEMVAAMIDPRNFDTTDNGGDAGAMSIDVVIPEVIGDYNGDGNFDEADARYFADGLALDPGTGILDRRAGFTKLDMAAGGDFFGYGPLITGKPYANGDARGDVAGSAYTTPGAAPTGADGVIDATDIDYVCANFADWSDLDQAVGKDLSCDMNGDLVIDGADVTELLEAILDTRAGDLDLDGDVDLADLGVMLANYGQSGVGYAGGDVNCDGIVDLGDLATLLGNFGYAR